MKFLGVDFDYYFENYPNKDGFFGKYGGYEGNLNKDALKELSYAYPEMLKSEEFLTMYERMKRWGMGELTPLVLLEKLSTENVKIYGKLKRKNSYGETPSMGQAFLARHLGKERIIASAEDGVAAVNSAGRGARIPCEVYVNPKISGDMFVMKIKVMGGSVILTDGDPEEEALKDFNENYETTYLFRKSASAPHPYPTIIRDFTKSIGDEAYKQFKEVESELPTAVITAVGKGENSLGFISGFTNIFTDIVAVNPQCEIAELNFLNDLERIRFAEVNSDEAIEAKEKIKNLENIKIDDTAASALAYALKYAEKLEKGIIIVNL